MNLPSSWSFTNIFNTDADRGRSPLPPTELRARLLGDLLFAEGLVVPATSLLCNPGTTVLRRDHRDLLHELVATGHLKPILTDDAPTFGALLDHLRTHRSRSLKFEPRSVDTAENARFLDAISGDSRSVTVKKTKIDSAKVALSLQLLDGLDDLGRLGGQVAYLKDLLNREQNRGQPVSGSWWAALGRKKRFRSYSALLTELGTMVFDLAHQSSVGAPIVGHPYGRRASTIAGLHGPLAAPAQEAIREHVFEMHDIEGPDWTDLRTLSAPQYFRLRERTRDERLRLTEATQLGIATKVWTATDVYMRRLAEELPDLVPSAASLRKTRRSARRWRSACFSLKCARHGLTIAVALLSTQYPDPWRMSLLLTLGIAASEAIQLREERLTGEIAELHEKAARLLPFSFGSGALVRRGVT